MKRISVLHVINSLGTGGAEKLLLESAPLYEKYGVDFKLLVLNGSEFPFYHEFVSRFPDRIQDLGKGSVYNPTKVFRLIPYMRHYDIVHAHLFPALYWVSMAKMLSFARSKLVFTEHNTHNRRREKTFFRILDRVIYGMYSRIICITSEVRDALLDVIGNPEKLTVIENGVSLVNSASAPEYPKKEISPGIADSDKLLIQVAGFRAQKDQKTVISSLQYLPENVKLLLVGSGELMSDTQNFALQLGLSHRVFFLGVRTDAASLVKSADIAVLSSHWEGFGLVAVEGMAAGKPFVASDVPGLSGVVGGAGVLFPAGDAKALAGEISKLLNDTQYYDRVADACRERASRYDIETMVSKYNELYRKLI